MHNIPLTVITLSYKNAKTKKPNNLQIMFWYFDNSESTFAEWCNTSVELREGTLPDHINFKLHSLVKPDLWM